MLPTHQGSIRLFRLAGIDVYLHWTWFIVAVWGYQMRRDDYSSPLWPALEYLALFLIVLLHEFGHSLACRQVGGKADQIVLWPLGGVAYVQPPPRPGAELWSIVAGPLVNVVLFPLLSAAVWLTATAGWKESMPNAYSFVSAVWFTNTVLLIFNLLPVYPLDGGQILRSLLWFVIGRARSLMVAAVIGLVGAAGFILWAINRSSIWMGVMAAFMLMNCWNGLKYALALRRMEKTQRRTGYACPACKTAPPAGEFWLCGKCSRPFDAFLTRAMCPHCGENFGVTACPECRNTGPVDDWVIPPPLPPRS